jgi:hypothetical protein
MAREERVMRKYEIEKGVPIPQCNGVGLASTLLSMDVNDSVLVSGVKKQSVNGAVQLARKKSNKTKTFITRSVGENMRVWRTS